MAPYWETVLDCSPWLSLAPPTWFPPPLHQLDLAPKPSANPAIQPTWNPFTSPVYQFSVVVVVAQSLNHIQLFVIPWTAACQPSLPFIISQSSLQLTFIESMMQPKHFILFHPLLLLSSIFPSISVFSNESVLHISWSKY